MPAAGLMVPVPLSAGGKGGLLPARQPLTSMGMSMRGDLAALQGQR